MTLRHQLRSSLITGLALVAPLVVTFVALRLLFGWLTGLIRPLVQATNLARYTSNIVIVAELLAVVLLVVTLVIIGYLARVGIGNRFFGSVDRAISLVPLIRTIYTSVRQVADSLLSQQSRYENVVLVEYPREGVYALGFVTADSPQPIQTATGPAYNVYLPNSPNPTNGHLAIVPEDQVTDIEMAPRRGIRLLVTTGMAETPDELEQLAEETEITFGGDRR